MSAGSKQDQLLIFDLDGTIIDSKRDLADSVNAMLTWMGRTPLSTWSGFVTAIPDWDVAADLPRIACPTLVITTEGSALGSVESMRAWQKKIPSSTLLALPGDSFHVAATDPDRCAAETLAFIRRSGLQGTS